MHAFSLASGRDGKLLLQSSLFSKRSPPILSVIFMGLCKFADLFFLYQMLTPGMESEKQAAQPTL